MKTRLLVLVGLTFHHSIFAWNVFGKDDRLPIRNHEAPWRMVGRLDTGCTGTLVGKNIVLTAAHCVFNDEKIDPKLKYFYPNLIQNVSSTRSAIKFIWYGTRTPELYPHLDWALLELKEDLGKIHGWMGVQEAPTEKIILTGYSSDFEHGKTATTHIGCQFTGSWNGTWLHNCDMTRGASGSPMFIKKNNGPYIVALNVAERRGGKTASLKLKEYSSKYANIAVPAKQFLKKLQELLK